ncbi:MAG: von Willebrand factor type A domain-containing protein [Lachnospiraceae bacterium]|nr:von Willebrand factor type A domain-containing protein [Lachnospiraceae bacterium]
MEMFTHKMKNNVGSFEKMISDELVKRGYDVSKGFSSKPSNKFIYPEYLVIMHTFVLVYLSLDGMNRFRISDDRKNSLFSSFLGTSSPMGMSKPGRTLDRSAMKGAVSFEAMSYDSMMDADEGMPSEIPVERCVASIEPSDNFSTSEFDAVKESGFLDTKTNPLSTFAASVNTASYANLRSILRNSAAETAGYTVDRLHDVRIDELVNYFKIDNVDNSKTFNVKAEILDSPWNKETKLMIANIRTK